MLIVSEEHNESEPTMNDNFSQLQAYLLRALLWLTKAVLLGCKYS